MPAINVSSMETVRAALSAFAEKRADGIIQVSTGGAEYASGEVLKDRIVGAIALAEYTHLLANRFDVYIGLHTDHCRPAMLGGFVHPLIIETKARRERGLPNLFNSHMFDGSELPLEENMRIARELVKEMEPLELVLEVEVGIVGGEEDGHDTSGRAREKLYTTPEDMVYAYEQLSPLTDCFLLAATFGNVHGVYQPGNVKLRPDILGTGQAAVSHRFGNDAFLYLVFHGGSGSAPEEIHEALKHGVVKMNVDTDAQYSYTRPIADHMFKNYDRVLKIEGSVGDKKAYDPRSYGRLGEQSMSAKVREICDELLCSGHSLFGSVAKID